MRLNVPASLQAPVGQCTVMPTSMHTSTQACHKVRPKGSSLTTRVMSVSQVQTHSLELRNAYYSSVHYLKQHCKWRDA